MTRSDFPPGAPRPPFPPPLLFALFFFGGYILQKLRPLPILSGDLHLIPALWFSVAGLLLFLAAWRAMRRADTSPNPYVPERALVVSGPYARSRNPMYLAFACLYLGLSSWYNALWPLVIFPGLIVAVNRLVIRREEARLSARFGDDYRDYARRVRRWV